MIFKVQHFWYDGPQVGVLLPKKDGTWAGFGYFPYATSLIEAMEALDPDWGIDSWPEGMWEWDGNTFRMMD